MFGEKENNNDTTQAFTVLKFARYAVKYNK